MNATVDQRFESALATLAAVERVTIDDVQRVADALSLDAIELMNAVTERRRDRDHDAAADAYALGFAAGKRAVDPVEQLGRDQEAGRLRRINNTPLGDDAA